MFNIEDSRTQEKLLKSFSHINKIQNFNLFNLSENKTNFPKYSAVQIVLGLLPLNVADCMYIFIYYVNM